MTRTEIQSTFVDLFALGERIPSGLDALQKAEAELGITFPQSFLDFAIHHGAIHTPDILTLVTGGESETIPEGASFDVQDFITPVQILESTQMYWAAGMEDWMVAFANDSMGNVFGFRKQVTDPRPDDSPVYLFDHDFCETHEEAPGFDAWLNSFIRMQKTGSNLG